MSRLPGVQARFFLRDTLSCVSQVSYHALPGLLGKEALKDGVAVLAHFYSGGVHCSSLVMVHFFRVPNLEEYYFRAEYTSTRSHEVIINRTDIN